MDCTAESHSHTIIFILGPPGSGKGTLCKLATDRLGTPNHHYFHLSVGDYLRELCNPAVTCEGKSFDHNEIYEHLRESKLLPADVLIPVLEHKINSIPKEKSATTTWLIDGFPRNMETALAFEEKVGTPMKIITLECKRDIAEGRFLRRGRESVDDEKRFDKRYSEYVKNMKAIREHYAGIMDAMETGANA
ncbi:P-loop containing nucleoside triphosphate hydrolase protein [Xylaria castorea]|nr:P-loop containing nucleoside triphosphate hydrolase protein [Xylaria castorea]